MSVTLQSNRKCSKTLYCHHLDQDAVYFHIPNSHHSSNEQTSQTMHEAGKLFDLLLSGVITVDDINNYQTLKLIKSQLSQKTNELKNDRTSQLWIQYMRAISKQSAQETGSFTSKQSMTCCHFSQHLDTVFMQNHHTCIYSSFLTSKQSSRVI